MRSGRWSPAGRRWGASRLNLLASALIVALLLAACAPGATMRDSYVIDKSPSFRAVTASEAARALDFAELEYMLASPAQSQGVPLSPLSGLISPAYRHVIPGVGFRASTSAVSADASYGQIYRWNLRPVPFERLRPGDLILYSDGSALVSGAGLFAGWRTPDREFQMLVANQDTGEVSYLSWDLSETEEGRRLVAIGQLIVAAAPF